VPLIWLQAQGRSASVWLQAQGGSPLDLLVPMGAIFLIIYFLLIRPQAKKQREHEKMLAALAKGDRVVTSGGLHGLVTGAEKDVLTLEIAVFKGERVRVKVDRVRIERRVEAAEKSDEKDKGAS
jgi:preprotein translocase subunit YajC